MKNIIVLKTIILSLFAFLTFSLYTMPIEAQTLVTLENLVSNGDFSEGVTGWSPNSTGDGYFIENNNIAEIGAITEGFGARYQNNKKVIGHVYYVGFDYTLISGNAVLDGFLGTTNILAVGDGNRYSTILTASSVLWQIRTNIAPTELLADNFLLIDLTATFGAGNEPDIEEFESHWLPAELDYFESYTAIRHSDTEIAIDGFLEPFSHYIFSILTWGTFDGTISEIDSNNFGQVFMSCIMGIITWGTVVLIVVSIIPRRGKW